MWCKLTYALSMHVGRGSIPAELEISETTKIVIWKKKIEQQSPQICCDVIAQIEANQHIGKMLACLETGKIPMETPPQVALPYQISFDLYIDEQGNIPEGYGAPFDILPNELQNFCNRVCLQLGDAATKFIQNLRWTQKASGKRRPFSHIGIWWSLDGLTWAILPTKISVIVSADGGLDISAKKLEEVRSLSRADLREPLHHELLREAFEIFGSSSRSALLIAVSALETGLKSYIQWIVPHSEIIIDKLQSPPAMVLVQDIIPRLHRTLNLQEKEFPLSDIDKKFLQKWIVQRNEVAHGRKKHLNDEDFLKFLEFVRAILYSLDVLMGHKWATKYSLSAIENHGSSDHPN